MSVSRLFVHTTDIYRTTDDYGELGGVKRTTALDESSVPGRFSESVPAERKTGDVEFAEATAVFYTDATTDVQRGDELRRGSTTYEVISVRTPSHRNAQLEAVLKVKQLG